MELHEFYLSESEFGRYFFRMTTNILLEPEELLQEGDLVKLIETKAPRDEKTGRHLMFRIKSIDLNFGVIDGKKVWNVDLRTLVSYDELRKRKERINRNQV